MLRVLVCLLVSLFYLGCLQKKSSPYVDYQLSKTLRYPISSEPPTLDWNKSTDTTSALVIGNIMSGLARYSFSKSKPEARPDLAESWEQVSSRVWIFRIKNQVYWSDNQALKASHFIDGWERLLNPKTGSEYAYFLFPIKNAKAYNEGKIKNFSEVGARINKQGHLRVELEEPLSYLPYLLTHPSTYPIRKDIIEKKSSLWTKPENIVTLGAYQLKRWDHDKALVLERNDKYHGELAKIEKVILYIIPEEKTILDLFLSKRLDVVPNLSSRDLPFFKKNPEYKSYGALSLYYYGFNVQASSLKDVRIRKALVHAIDRSQVVNLLNSNQLALKSWIPQGLFGYNKQIGLSFDPEKAKKLLDQAGYKDRTKFPKLDISYNTTADHKMLAENIQSQLRKNLGIEVELKNQEWKTYLQKLSLGDTQVFRMGWMADYPDPDNFMNLMTSFSDNNHTYWKNKEYDKLILEARSVPDGKKRKKLYDQAQSLLLEKDVAVFPIFSGVAHKLVSSRLKNYPLNVMSETLFQRIEIKNENK